MSHPVMASRDDASPAPHAQSAFPQIVRLLAVRVQFQADADVRTSGNGQFDLSTPADPALDAPPRNADYFRDHLTFLADYYAQASKARVTVQWTLLDSVFTLPAVMSSYSPAKNATNLPLATLARDTWTRVDGAGAVSDVAAYDCFVIFHAGVGRDVDLVATLGYDPTPSDIPSLYLGPKAFQQLLGTPGIPVRNGTSLIPNTIIMPETENRLLPGAGGDVPLRLGINGLLCASVGNYLGLPDLFNTKTGASAIGRFGLMDGQSIFSFGGAFPPEPSAWEKYWLGWVEPVVLPAQTTVVSLPAVALADTIYRVPISSQEYYLVENRNRDARRDGQTFVMRYGGVFTSLRIQKDTAGLNQDDISLIKGNVIHVDELDWSIPGFVEPDGTFYDGGVLIWHIDEVQIARTIGANEVNADPAHRGVDLEEADGSQDIGETYDLLQPGAGSESGTPLDFWFSGNNAPVYKNLFNASTQPPSVSYTGARTAVEIGGFSPRGPHMTAQISRSMSTVTPVPGFPVSTGEQLAPHALTLFAPVPAPGVGTLEPSITVVTTGIPLQRPATTGTLPAPAQPGKVYGWSLASSLVSPGAGPAPLRGFPSAIIARAPSAAAGFTTGASLMTTRITGALEGPADTMVVPVAGGLSWFALHDLNADSLADNVRSLPGAGRSSTPVLLTDSVTIVGTDSGTAIFATSAGQLMGSIPVAAGSAVAGIAVNPHLPRTVVLAGADGTLLQASWLGTRVALMGAPVKLGHPLAGPPVVALFATSSAAGSDGSASARIAVTTQDGLLYLLYPDALGAVPGFPVNTGGPISEPAALADIDGDGQRDIIVFSGNRICAYNTAGVLLNNFPVTVGSGQPITSAPVVADVDGDGSPEIVAVTADGLVAACTAQGAQAAGFPLPAGTGRQSAAVFTTVGASGGGSSAGMIGLVVASSDAGSVSAWITRTDAGVPPGATLASMNPWPQFQRDARHSGAESAALPLRAAQSEFFPKNRAYNWPNPVYDGKTYIRYYLRTDATVRIRIYDMAGYLVTELNGPGTGGVDNEVLWNVGTVQSGIYFAHVEANGAAGSGKAVIKVAVVR